MATSNNTQQKFCFSNDNFCIGVTHEQHLVCYHADYCMLIHLEQNLPVKRINPILTSDFFSLETTFSIYIRPIATFTSVEAVTPN